MTTFLDLTMEEAHAGDSTHGEPVSLHQVIGELAVERMRLVERFRHFNCPTIQGQLVDVAALAYRGLALMLQGCTVGDHVDRIRDLAGPDADALHYAHPAEFINTLDKVYHDILALDADDGHKLAGALSILYLHAEACNQCLYGGPP